MKKTLPLFIFLILNLADHAQGGTWTWVKGDTTSNSLRHLGTKGVSDPADYPQGRYQAVQWTDLNGNFWVFGGLATGGCLNDLWRYEPASNIWTWIKGDTMVNSHGVYGTMGIPAPANTPGARWFGSSSWTDHQGRLWMHGSYGYDANGSIGYMDDMWTYDIPTNQWTWMKGSDIAGSTISYGTLQVPDPANTPGARNESNTTWVRSDGTLWTFGGQSNQGYLNDIWKFDISTNEWTWMKGPQGGNTTYNLGTKGIESDTAYPASGGAYCTWQDSHDQFYLFSEASAQHYANVWRYNSNNNKWTWIAGTGALNDPGSLTQKCHPDGVTHPCSSIEYRTAQTTMCNDDIFWLFGGASSLGDMNYLLGFDLRTLQWTWVSGSNSGNPHGHFGTINVPSPANVPPAKAGHCMWADQSGGIWVWAQSEYSDMWHYVPDINCLFPPPIVSIGDTTLCIGDTFHISVDQGRIISIAPATAVTMLDSAHAIITPSQSLRYTLIAGGTCSRIDTIPFLLDPVQHFSTHISRVLCPGDSLTYHSQVITSSVTITDTLISRFGCDSIVTFTAIVLPTYSDTVRQTICSNATFSMGGRTVDSAGTYPFTFTSASGCDSAVTLLLSIIPVSTSAVVASICAGDSFTFYGRSITTSGTYYDTLVNSLHCDSIVSLFIKVYPRPIADFSLTPTGDSVPFGNIAFINNSQNSDSVFELLNDHLVTLSKNNLLPITDTGTYCIRLIAISSAGCSDTTRQCIYVFQNAFAMPNAFTPNGDGKNDIFYPVFISHDGISVTSFKIYNRRGQQVHADPTHGWDGSYDGKPQPGDVYTYFITVDIPDSSHPDKPREIKKEGSVTLIR